MSKQGQILESEKTIREYLPFLEQAISGQDRELALEVHGILQAATREIMQLRNLKSDRRFRGDLGAIGYRLRNL